MFGKLFGAAAGSAAAAGITAVYYSRHVTAPAAGPEAGTLLRKYADSSAGIAVPPDTVSLTVPGNVDVEGFMRAFLVSKIFRMERGVLPQATTDEQARAFAAGSPEPFATWKNAERTDSEILTTWDGEGAHGATWFRAVPQDNGTTRLDFGSAMGCSEEADSWSDKFIVPLVMPMHVLYSKVLLQSTADALALQAASDARA